MGNQFMRLIWKRRCEEVIKICYHSERFFRKFYNHWDKIKIVMHTENENWLHFVDLILISKGCNYILVKVYSKPNKSFTYMNPGNCYPLKVENKYLKALLYNEVTHLWPRWKIRKRTFHDDARKLRYKVSRKVSVRSRMFYLTLSTTSTCAAIQNLLLMVVF